MPFGLLNKDIGSRADTRHANRATATKPCSTGAMDRPSASAITSTPVNEPTSRRRRVIIVRDITQELAMKAQKDRFFARASHELRTPLSNIMTRLYLLRKKPDQLETHLHVLDQVSEQMMELVNDLLDVSRAEQGAPDPQPPRSGAAKPDQHGGRYTAGRRRDEGDAPYAAN